MECNIGFAIRHKAFDGLEWAVLFVTMYIIKPSGLVTSGFTIFAAYGSSEMLDHCLQLCIVVIANSLLADWTFRVPRRLAEVADVVAVLAHSEEPSMNDVRVRMHLGGFNIA